MDWIICPVVKIINYAITQLDNALISLLQVDPKIVDESNGDYGAHYYTAWQSFRNIAIGILVIAALIMIIGQALGLEVLDAYTLKKVAPRLIIAILGIALSWELMKWFIYFTNDLGLGVRSLIYAPFNGINHGQINIGSAGVMTYLAVPAIFAMGIWILLLYGATAFLALLIAFMVLVARQIVIVMLILLAPVAIACYVLPNTQGIWKLWHESFTKALLMFPIIMAFLAAGRAFALVSTGPGTGPVEHVVAFIAYIIPYFLIPMTFKFAGGAMRTLGGFANDKSRGLFDRTRKLRSNAAKNRWDRAKTGTLYAGKNPISKGAMALTKGAYATSQTRLGFNPKRWKGAVQSTLSNSGLHHAEEYIKDSKEFDAVKNNDDLLEAGTQHGAWQNYSKIYQYLKDHDYSDVDARQGANAVLQAQRRTSKETFDIAATLSLPGTGTAFKDGAGEMHAKINEVGGNDSVLKSRMLASMRSSASQARRPDLAGGGYGDQLKTLQQQYDQEQAILARTDINVATKQRLIADVRTAATMHIHQASLEGQGGGAIVSARKRTVEAMAPVMKAKLDQIVSGLTYTVPQLDSDGKEVKDAAGNTVMVPMHNMEDLDRELAAIAGRYDAMAQVAPENARVMADKVMGGIITDPANGRTTTVQQLIEMRRGSTKFQEMRREYQSAGIAAAVAAQQQPAGAPGGPATPTGGPGPTS